MNLPRNPLTQLTPRRIRGLEQMLAGRVWQRREALAVTSSATLEQEVGVDAAGGLDYAPMSSGEAFSPPDGAWQQRWFRLAIPAAAADEVGRRHLIWQCNGEGCVYIDGLPWAGLDPGHPSCPLPDTACELFIDVGTYQTAIWVDNGFLNGQPCRFTGAWLGLRDLDLWQLYHDVRVIMDWLRLKLRDTAHAREDGVGYKPAFERLEPVVRRALHLMDRACDLYELGELGELQMHMARVYSELRGCAWEGEVALVGHAHMDLVWLWPERVTRRKGVHFFSTVLRLLERYPEFTFLQSQPALYEMVAERAPGLMPAVRAHIASGRWEATGAMEVEADTIIPCGEALARNLIYGQQRFVELCGRPSRTLWLPDVFGYSACLPQMLRQVGVDRFFTTKIAWSDITRFPHTSLRWRGLDGSEVLTHLCKSSYNGGCEIDLLDAAVRGNDQGGVHAEQLLPTGLGDGGGGPSEEMLERARRTRDLAGLPRTRWSTCEAFFDRLEQVRPELPVYEGELYLELHRGTYTTQSAFKQVHRRAERALLAHEALRVLSGGSGIDAADWRRLIFAQFHDAIPGSSITDVYAELAAELGELCARQERAATALCEQPGASGLRVVNPWPLPRTLSVQLDASQRGDPALGLRTDDGTPVPLQRCASPGADIWLARVRVSACAAVGVHPDPAAADAAAIHASATELDNGIVRAGFDAQGQLCTLRADGRELAIERCGLWLYPDHPTHHPAWEIEREALSLGCALDSDGPAQVLEAGPARAVLSSTIQIAQRSCAELRYILQADSDQLEIELTVDWNEADLLLKYRIDTGYRGRLARFGTPFGSMTRSQYPGLPHEEAQFEVCFNRWLALTDAGEEDGLALIAEAKYGCDVRDGSVGLSLLRAPPGPDPAADRGAHTIRFALGAWRA
ncbi:MAG: alpha-mannosidase, partial [Planctomycetota bacterium]